MFDESLDIPHEEHQLKHERRADIAHVRNGGSQHSQLSVDLQMHGSSVKIATIVLT